MAHVIVSVFLSSILALTGGTTTTDTPSTLRVPDTFNTGTLVVRVPSGDFAVMTCALPGVLSHTDTPMLVWDRQGVAGAIAIGGVIQAGRGARYSITTSPNGGQTLSISNVQLDDSDIYRCYPFTQANNVVNTNLTVLVPPVSVVVSVVTDPVQEGRPVRVTCTTASRPAADLTWTITRTSGEAHVLHGTVTDLWNPNGTVTRTSEVFLPASRGIYGAVFTCTGRLDELSYTQEALHTLLVNVGPQQPVLAPPQPAAVEGVRTHLTCTAPDARPAATVQWFWENDPVNGDVTMTSHDNGTSDVMNTLYVTPTERLNGVMFMCRVGHDVLTSAGAPPYQLQHVLNVQYKPRVSVAESRQTVWEGSPLVVTCSFYSNPNVTHVTWYKNDVMLTSGDRTSMTRDEEAATLTITGSRKGDTGEYRCEATNVVGSSKSDVVTVLALHSPVCDTDQKFQYGTAIGHTASLLCRVEALPSALVFFGWSINGSDWLISEGQRDPNDPTVAISVHNITVRSEADYGNVTCKAYNGVNEMSQPCVLKLRKPGPAEAPHLCEITDESDTGATIDCHDAYDGGYPASYWLQWRDFSSNVYNTASNLTDYDFLVSGLKSGRMYPMRVCTANAVYWQNVSCTPDFLVATRGAPAAGGVSANYSSSNVNIIIGGVVGGVCLLCLIAIIVEVTVLRKRDKKRMKEDAELYSRAYTNPAAETLEMRERHPRSPPGEIFRKSRELTNIDEPLYDSADGLKEKLTQARVQALTVQGKRESIVDSPVLSESSGDPEKGVAEVVLEKAQDEGTAAGRDVSVGDNGGVVKPIVPQIVVEPPTNYMADV